MPLVIIPPSAPDQDHRHLRVNAAAEHKRLEHADFSNIDHS